MKNVSTLKKQKIADNSKFEDKKEIVVTDEIIKARLSKTTLLTPKTNRVKLNGKIVLVDTDNENVKPELIDGNITITYDFITNIIPCELEKTHDTVIYTMGNDKLSLTIGSSKGLGNGVVIPLSVAVYIKHNKIYVPLNEVCDFFGKTADKVNISGFTIITNKGEEFDLDSQLDLKIMNHGALEILYDYPTTEEIVKLFDEKTNNNHPRLFYTPEDISKLRENIKVEPYKTWAENVLNKADDLIEADIEKTFFYDLIGVRLLNMCRKVYNHIKYVAMAYILTGDIKYADNVVAVMDRVCDPCVFPDWHPYHFLDTAEMAFAVGLGFDWCYDRLTDDQKSTITETIEKYALETVMEDYLELERERTWYWSSPSSAPYPQNWIDVCFGGTVAAALAVGDEPSFKNKSIIGDVIREGMDRFRDYSDTLSPDGTYRDGTTYWEYSHRYKLYGVDALRSVLGTDYGLTNAIGFEQCFLWLIEVTGPKGTFNFDSNAQMIVNSSAFFWLGNYLGEAKYNNYRLDQIKTHNLETGFEDLLWYKHIEGDDKLTIPTEMATRNIGILTLRQGFDKNDTYLAAYTANPYHDGYVDQEHDGTFVLDMSGVRWAVDLGAENGGYYGTLPKYKYYRWRAEGHNTVIIQPSLDHNHDPFKVGKLKSMDHDDKFSYAIYDFTDKLAYKGATMWKRGYKINKVTGGCIVQDELKAKKMVEYYWNMHTLADIELINDGKSAILTQDGKKIQLNLISDKHLCFEARKAEPLPTSPQRTDPAESDNSKFKKLVVHAEGVKEINMAVEFISMDYVSSLKYTPLDMWNSEI